MPSVWVSSGVSRKLPLCVIIIVMPCLRSSTSMAVSCPFQLLTNLMFQSGGQIGNWSLCQLHVIRRYRAFLVSNAANIRYNMLFEMFSSYKSLVIRPITSTSSMRSSQLIPPHDIIPPSPKLALSSRIHHNFSEDVVSLSSFNNWILVSSVKIIFFHCSIFHWTWLTNYNLEMYYKAS